MISDLWVFCAIKMSSNELVGLILTYGECQQNAAAACRLYKRKIPFTIPSGSATLCKFRYQTSRHSVFKGTTRKSRWKTSSTQNGEDLGRNFRNCRRRPKNEHYPQQLKQKLFIVKCKKLLPRTMLSLPFSTGTSFTTRRLSQKGCILSVAFT